VRPLSKRWGGSLRRPKDSHPLESPHDSSLLQFSLAVPKHAARQLRSSLSVRIRLPKKQSPKRLYFRFFQFLMSLAVLGGKNALRAFWGQMEGAGGFPPKSRRASGLLRIADSSPRCCAYTSYQESLFYERIVPLRRFCFDLVLSWLGWGHFAEWKKEYVQQGWRKTCCNGGKCLSS